MDSNTPVADSGLVCNIGRLAASIGRLLPRRNRLPGTNARPGKRLLRLVAGNEYFGIDAVRFTKGAKRLVSRSAIGGRRARIDVDAVAEEFWLDSTAAAVLLEALRAEDLLRPHDKQGYRPTTKLKAYARAKVVKPLSRNRARALISEVCSVAERVNGWSRCPLKIEAVAVSGSFMSRSDSIDELSVWLVAVPEQMSGSAITRTMGPEEALNAISRAVSGVSSFIRLHVVSDRALIERPFAIPFVADSQA